MERLQAQGTGKDQINLQDIVKQPPEIGGKGSSRLLKVTPQSFWKALSLNHTELIQIAGITTLIGGQWLASVPSLDRDRLGLLNPLGQADSAQASEVRTFLAPENPFYGLLQRECQGSIL